MSFITQAPQCQLVAQRLSFPLNILCPRFDSQLETLQKSFYPQSCRDNIKQVHGKVTSQRELYNIGSQLQSTLSLAQPLLRNICVDGRQYYYRWLQHCYLFELNRFSMLHFMTSKLTKFRLQLYKQRCLRRYNQVLGSCVVL